MRTRTTNHTLSPLGELDFWKKVIIYCKKGMPNTAKQLPLGWKKFLKCTAQCMKVQMSWGKNPVKDRLVMWLLTHVPLINLINTHKSLLSDPSRNTERKPYVHFMCVRKHLKCNFVLLETTGHDFSHRVKFHTIKSSWVATCILYMCP